MDPVDDDQTLRLLRLFNEPNGKKWLRILGANTIAIDKLNELGISSICNLIAAIKLAKYYEMNENDIIFTIFTDSVDMYYSRLIEMNEARSIYSEVQAEIDWTTAIKNQSIDYFKELSYYDKKAIHNLKYFTWVEQQGKDVKELNEQWYDEYYWHQRFSVVPMWNKLIEDFNQQVGVE